MHVHAVSTTWQEECHVWVRHVWVQCIHKHTAVCCLPEPRRKMDFSCVYTTTPTYHLM